MISGIIKRQFSFGGLSLFWWARRAHVLAQDFALAAKSVKKR